MAGKLMKVSNNIAKMHQVFGKKLYADKYAFISELCQNAVDSHRMAGIKDPVKVGIKKAGGNWIFYVQDFGLSFDSIEDFEDKVCTLLESGKSAEKTNDEDCPMGMHGIGSISVSKFNSEWKYTVVKNGRLFTCKIKEIDGKGLEADPSNYVPSNDAQGVLVEVVIPTNESFNSFIQAMKDKLCYFKDILFEFDSYCLSMDKTLLTLNTNFKLLQGTDFVVSSLSRINEVHICLDQYSYRIKWHELGMAPISQNIALKFGMGEGLEADLTRENLNIDENYKEIITSKLEKVATWLVERYNKQIPDEFTDFSQFLKLYGVPRTVDVNGRTYVLNEFERFSSVKAKELKFKGVSDEVIDPFFKNTNKGIGLFESRYTINHRGSKVRNQYTEVRVIGGAGQYLVKDKVSPLTMAYLKAHDKGCKLIYNKDVTLFPPKMNKQSKQNWQWILDLGRHRTTMKQVYKSVGINVWRERIKEAQILVEEFGKIYFKTVESVKVPDEFKNSLKAKSNKKAKIDLKNMTGEVGIKYAENITCYSSQYSCKFTEKVIQVKDLRKTPKLHIYGTEAQREALDYAFTLLQHKKTVAVCIIGEKNQKHIKKLNLHNFMNIEDFFKGKHDVFRQVMTAYMINEELLTKYPETFNNKQIIADHLSLKFAEDLNELQKFVGNYKPDEFLDRHGRNTKFMEALKVLTHEGKLYDLTVWEKFQKVKAYIDRFDFVDFFAPTLGGSVETKKKSAIEAMQDVARHRKVRMDWEHYKLLDKE